MSRPTVSTRIKREADTVRAMISIYCRLTHKVEDAPCNECSALMDYAGERLEKCPFQADKPTCASCSVHCYKSDQRQRIREVMRKAGPSMLVHHPILTVMHFWDEYVTGRKWKIKE